MGTQIDRKHWHCPTQVVVGPFGPHYAKLECTKHKKVIQWLSKSNAEELQQCNIG